MSKAPLPDALCAYCSALIDDFTAVEEGTIPSEGDFMMCVYCGNVNIFCEQTRMMRKATQVDMEEVSKDLLRLAKERIAWGDYGSHK